MTAERQSEESSLNLEKFKGHSDAPFEVVSKEEALPRYSPIFKRKLKDNWTKVCQLMDWKVDGVTPDWQFFEVAKNPTTLVEALQAKIIEKGGKLPKYGIDGKFGPETEKALASVLTPVEILEPTALPAAPVATVEPAPTSEPFAEERMKKTTEQVEKAHARIDEAGLKISGNDENAAAVVDDMELLSYQTKAAKFREAIMEGRPDLKKIAPSMEKMLDAAEDNIHKIDLSKIQTIEEFDVVVANAYEGLGEKIVDLFLHPERNEPGKQEDLLTIYLSLQEEMLAILTNHLEKDQINLDRIEALKKKRSEERRAEAARTFPEMRWQEEVIYNNEKVKLDLLSLSGPCAIRLIVDETRYQVAIYPPKGQYFDSAISGANGGIVVKMKGQTQNLIISKDQINKMVKATLDQAVAKHEKREFAPFSMDLGSGLTAQTEPIILNR